MTYIPALTHPARAGPGLSAAPGPSSTAGFLAAPGAWAAGGFSVKERTRPSSSATTSP